MASEGLPLLRQVAVCEKIHPTQGLELVLLTLELPAQAVQLRFEAGNFLDDYLNLRFIGLKLAFGFLGPLQLLSLGDFFRVSPGNDVQVRLKAINELQSKKSAYRTPQHLG